jgi:hypothetical protein
MANASLPRRSLLALLALSAAAGVPPLHTASAHPPEPDSSWLPRERHYQVILEDDDGRPLRTFWKGGTRFALGEQGRRYAVRIVNHTNERVEAVLSVDGRDAVSGRRASYLKERGYLIGPHDSVVVKGFRRSTSEVATFRFTSPDDSYSSRMGTPENVGVIGVAIFPEAVRRARRPLWLRERPAPSSGGADASSRAPKAGDSYEGHGAAAERSAPSTRGAGARPRAYAPPSRDEENNLGTQYGEHRQSRVNEVSFARRDPRRPEAVLTLRYDDAQGLEARGIAVYPRPRPPYHSPHHPVAFPDSRFAPPPP